MKWTLVLGYIAYISNQSFHIVGWGFPYHKPNTMTKQGPSEEKPGFGCKLNPQASSDIYLCNKNVTMWTHCNIVADIIIVCFTTTDAVQANKLANCINK